jgi:hypothetical protein
MGLASIETDIARIAAALERIADGLQRPLERTPEKTFSSQAPAEMVKAPMAHIPQESPSGIAYDTVRKALLGYSDRFGAKAGQDLIARFKNERGETAKYIKDLKDSDYPAVIEALKGAP